MSLPQREVEVRKIKYKFFLVGSMKALNALRRITGKMSALIPNLISQNSDKVNEDFYNLITDEYDFLFETFIDSHSLLYKEKGEDWKNIGGPDGLDEHFAGKCTAPVELLYKVIVENDKSFFHLLPTLINKGLEKLNEKLQANSLQMPKGLEPMDNIAKMMKENLG